MARKPWDEVPIIPLQRPASADLNQMTSYERLAMLNFLQNSFNRRTAIADATAQTQEGMIGDAFRVRPLDPAVLKVTIQAGLGFQYDPSGIALNLDASVPVGPVGGLDDLSGFKPLVLPTPLTVAVPTPPGVGSSRYDIIEIRYRREFIDRAPDLIFDPIVNDFVPEIVPQTLTWAMDANSIGYVTTPNPSTTPIGYKVGTTAPTGTQVEPPTTDGYIKIARVLVGEGTTAITGLEILDNRFMLASFDMHSAVAEVAMPIVGALAPTVNKLRTEPGTQLVFVGNNLANAQMDCYLLAGGNVDPDLTDAGITFQATPIPYDNLTTGNGLYVVQYSQVTRGRVDGALQAILAGAGAANPIDVAIGQPYALVQVQTGNQNGGTTSFNLPALGTPPTGNKMRYAIRWTY